ncbi:uncharacterized protein LOC129870675 [Solanum dulcamara]|uniref:uncharacterized protein LOC129870675 n=1 Tax=Solanum dulcamara TaxID=45834 RepID=UPI00248635DF|nr:uncharacterized protein LOC129870675 [Solanum dulcamara]
MAKGGSMKGHMQSHNMNGSKGRTTYVVLLLLAFGVATFGVMILHKLRERRIFNLLVKDQEIELIHLKLLLQKEREHTKEAKRKAEEMKSKMQWIRTQRRDLESKIMEMKSTISSLQDEQRVIEVALEEKQDEIKMLTEKLTEMNLKDSQAKLLSESVQQNEAEIDIPVKVWSVSADDPSNPTINFTTKAAGTKEATGGETEQLRESIKRDDQKNSAENIHRKATRQGEDRGQAQDGEGSADWRSNTGERESRELRTAQEDVPGDISSTIFQTLDGKRETTNNSKSEEIFLEEKRYDNGDSSVETINHSGQVQKQSKEVGVIDATDWEEHGTAADFADSQGNNQESRQKYKDGMKLEMKEKHKSTDASRVKQEHIRKTKGKSRRIIAEKKVTGSGGNTEKRSIVSMRNRKLFKEIQESATNERVGGSKQEKQKHKQEKSMNPYRRNEYDPEDHRIDMIQKTQRFKNLEENFGNQVRFKPEQKLDMRKQRMQDDNSNLDDAPRRKTAPNTKKPAGAQEGIREGRKSDTNEITEKGQEREANNTESEMSRSSQEVPTKTAASNVNRVSKDTRNKKSDETTQSLEAIGIIREHQEQEQADSLPNFSEHANISERDVKADDLQVENDQETGGVVDQSRGISQEVRYQKLNSTARAEEENNTIFIDTEQRLGGNLHSSSTHVRNAEMAFKDSNLDTENDKETEDEDHSIGSAANLEEEGEDVN